MGQDDGKKPHKRVIWVVLALSLALNVVLIVRDTVLRVQLAAVTSELSTNSQEIIAIGDMLIRLAETMNESGPMMPDQAELYIAEAQRMVDGLIPKNCDFVKEAVSWIFNNGTQDQKDRICALNDELECDAPECAA